MHWYEKINFKKLIRWINNNWKLLLIFSGILGIPFTCYTLKKYNIENTDICLAVQKWHTQLPEEHWIKNKDNKYFKEDFFEYQLMDSYEQLKSYSHTFFKISNVAISQEGMAGYFFAKAMEEIDSRNKKKFHLKNSEGKTIKKITLKVEEIYTVFFFYDKTEMLLDFSEEEYLDEISHFKSNKFSLANRIVFSYSDNPEIAVIFNGRITGVSKGKTTIHFACNGYLFSYNVKVK